jgi:secreted Zn-dependent insulinase-like peptidase
MNENPKNFMLFKIYLSLFNYYVGNQLFYAQVCNTGFEIDVSNESIIISFLGYNNNIHKIVDLFMNTFFDFVKDITKDVFDYIKTNQIDNLDNFIYAELRILAASKFEENIYKNSYSYNELKNAIDTIEFTDINKPSEWLRTNYNMKVFIYGNINQDIININKKFNVFSNGNITIENDIIELRDSVSQIYIVKSSNKKNNNYLINIFYEIGYVIKNVTKDWELIILSVLFVVMYVKEKFFTQLRTKEQTGYIVRALSTVYPGNHGNLYGISFLVQSPHVNPIVLKRKIKTFISKMHESLKKIKPEKFELYKNNIKLHLKQKILSPYDEHDFIFDKL